MSLYSVTLRAAESIVRDAHLFNLVSYYFRTLFVTLLILTGQFRQGSVIAGLLYLQLYMTWT